MPVKTWDGWWRPSSWSLSESRCGLLLGQIGRDEGGWSFVPGGVPGSQEAECVVDMMPYDEGRKRRRELARRKHWQSYHCGCNKYCKLSVQRQPCFKFPSSLYRAWFHAPPPLYKVDLQYLFRISATPIHGYPTLFRGVGGPVYLICFTLP